MTNSNPQSTLESRSDSQALLGQVIYDYLKEKKSKRRWKWIKRVALLILMIFSVLLFYFYNDEEIGINNKPHVGLVDLKGEIFEARGGNADDFAKGLENAYSNKGLKALIIRINSPGGSPVQAEYMYNAIHYYKAKFPQVKIHAVCVDLCASAAYYVAVAADSIYASPASMVGSIGVIYNGFGFVDTIAKLGVSRRVQTSGSNKGFMDPFGPITDFQKQTLQTMLDIIHQQFIKRVKEGRGNRLHINDETFSGLFWTGEQALNMGLIDGFASSGQLAREIIKVEDVIDYTHKANLFDRVAKNLGTALADELPLSLGMRSGIR